MTVQWKARPTTYKGIAMRSRLEAKWAAGMDAHGVPWTYEPRAYGNEQGQYLQDFEIPPYDGDDRHWFVEVKPTVELAMKTLARMQIIWDSEPDAYLMVVVPDAGLAYVADRECPWQIETYA